MWTRLRGWLVPVLLLGTMAYAIAEEITLTTYYPSPRGMYQELRTAGNVQIGRIEPPADPAIAPRLRIYRERNGSDGVETPLLVVEDERPNGGTDPDPTPFVIDEQGNVGIGEPIPRYGLDIKGPAAAAGTLRLQPGSAPTVTDDGLLYYDTAIGKIQARQGGAWVDFGGPWTTTGTHISNANTGNVGIGTTGPPAAKLDVVGDIQFGSTKSLKLSVVSGTNPTCPDGTAPSLRYWSEVRCNDGRDCNNCSAGPGWSPSGFSCLYGGFHGGRCGAPELTCSTSSWTEGFCIVSGSR